MAGSYLVGTPILDAYSYLQGAGLPLNVFRTGR